jgi:hypothetical protein
MTQHATTDLIKTYAERLALEQVTRAENRRIDLEEQRSELNSPDARIRVWEKLHGLSLPSDPTHPIVDVIAVSTRLTIAEVQEVQRKHAAQRAARPASRLAADLDSYSTSLGAHDAI